MVKKVIVSNGAPSAIGPYSQAIQVGGFVFVSGQIALVTGQEPQVSGDIAMQTSQVLLNIEKILKEAGLGLDNVVKITVCMVDLSEFKKMNEIYGGYFKNNAPARSTVQVAALPRGAKILIEAIASTE